MSEMKKKTYNPVNQHKKQPNKLNQYSWKPGQSGNPKGRPKGKTLKEFAREYLSSLSDNEKIKYLSTLPTDIVWKMAEGNPAQDLTSGGEKLSQIPIYGSQSIQGHDSNKSDIQSEKKN